MKLDELLQQARADHDRDPADVANRLEQGLTLVHGLADAASLARDAAHVIGQHLGQWARAAALVAAAIERADQPAAPAAAVAGGGTVGDSVAAADAGSAERSRAFSDLALCRTLSGEAALAAVSELQALAAVPDRALVTLLRLRLLTVEGLAAAGRIEESGSLYRAVLALVERVPALEPDAARTLAICSNNLAGALLERDAGGGGDTADGSDVRRDALMRLSAVTARRYWLTAGGWTQDERSDYLLALVERACGDASAALEHAEHALATCAANGGEPIDEAFLHLVAAGAHGDLGRADQQAAALQRADAARAAIDAAGCGEWFERERTKALARRGL